MKRIMIWSGLALLLVATGIFVARAHGSGRQGFGRGGWSHHGPLGYVAYELNLSDAQKSQIQSMWEAERPAVASLLQELASENREMDSATAQGSLDDSKVAAIAALQGSTISRLLVEKERLKSRVYTNVLNPEQRAKPDELQKEWRSRLDYVAARIGNGGGRRPTALWFCHEEKAGPRHEYSNNPHRRYSFRPQGSIPALASGGILR